MERQQVMRRIVPMDLYSYLTKRLSCARLAPISCWTIRFTMASNISYRTVESKAKKKPDPWSG